LSLYAQWTLDTVTPVIHTVTFKENDSSADSVTSSMSENTIFQLTLFVNLRPIFVNNSHTFVDWNTSSDGSGTSYSDGAQYAFQSNLVLYAQWTLTAVVVTYNFVGNGGSGSVPSISGSIGSTFRMPGQSGFIRAGYVLIDWNTSANGSGTKYLIGESVTATASVVLYAQWHGKRVSTLFSAIGVFKAGSSSLSAALKSQINRVARTIMLRKYLKIDLFGYTSTTGLRSLNVSLSRTRARNVAVFLRSRLNDLKDHGVSIFSAGEGAIPGQSSNAYSRVEVFGV
jgi:flagellar motor protein MotB